MTVLISLVRPTGLTAVSRMFTALTSDEVTTYRRGECTLFVTRLSGTIAN
jgi:hypothetical protein